jgi:hypothetical protein
MAMIEKSVERCTMELNPTEGTAVFKLHCYHGNADRQHATVSFTAPSRFA